MQDWFFLHFWKLIKIKFFYFITFSSVSQKSNYLDFDVSFLNRFPFPNFPTWHRDARDNLKRKWKFKSGVLKTRCPSYCQRCLRVIPPLVVGLANWLSTPRLPVFGVQFQVETAFPSYKFVLEKRAFSNFVFLSLFLPSAHLSGISNFNIPLLEFFIAPVLWERHHRKKEFSLMMSSD